VMCSRRDNATLALARYTASTLNGPHGETAMYRVSLARKHESVALLLKRNSVAKYATVMCSRRDNATLALARYTAKHRTGPHGLDAQLNAVAAKSLDLVV
jgi:hypothetical protein